MPELVIQIPAEHKLAIVKSIARTYGVDPTMAGLKEHIIQHLRQTVTDFERDNARARAEFDFDITWADLEVKPIVLPVLPDEASAAEEAGATEELRQSRPDDVT